MTDLSIIIVSYNTKKVTLEAVEELKKNYARQLSDKEFEIIVVDNASADESGKMLKSLPGITFIQNPINVGFSKANNKGIKKATGRYILFLNSDTLVPSVTLTEMIKFMDKNVDVGASTCKLLLPNGKIDDASHRGFPTPWNAFCFFVGLEKLFPHSRLFSGYHMGWKNLDKDHRIDCLAGSFMLVRRKAGDEAGWWDEDYFFYGEDIDFCYMLKQKKWKIYYLAGVTTLHLKGVSGGIKKISENITTADKKTKARATKSRFKAMILFYDKHYIQKYPFWLTSLIKLFIQMRLWYNLHKLGVK